MRTETGAGVSPSKSVIGDQVSNLRGEELGHIEELMIDLQNGRVHYAILSFGGLMGMGDKLFPVPWELMKPDPENQRFLFQVTREMLKTAPGFRRDDWPEMNDREWSKAIHSFYNKQPYWQTQKHDRRGERPGRRREDISPGKTQT